MATKQQREYYAKLKDPRWQKKRLEIMERDGFQCVNCGDSDKTLTIHHQYYNKDTEPWDYPNESLYTLCEECHKEFEDEKKHITELLKSTTIYDQGCIIGYLQTMIQARKFNVDDEDSVVEPYKWREGYIYGIADGMQLSHDHAERIFCDRVNKNGTGNIKYSELLNIARRQ